MKKYSEKIKLALPVLLYFIIYMIWFEYIEKHSVSAYTIISTKIDYKIPFCEVFIIPYVMWFGYIAWIVAYTFFKDEKGYINVTRYLMIGMTVFLLISTFFPNVHRLRPYMMPRDNVFCSMVKFLYRIDTPTNLWPSIHVYNSIGVYAAVAHDERLGKNKWVNNGCAVLSTLIIMSTLFLKQHSMFDVLTGIIMSVVVYVLVYRMDIITDIRANYLKKKKDRKVYIK